MTHAEEAAARREEKLQKEKQRIQNMRRFEQSMAEEQYPELASRDHRESQAAELQAPLPLLAGIDEAGRGPLAGPVAAGAVILPGDSDILYINDSKKLTPRRRELLYEQIKKEAISWHVALVDAARIDEINILQATYEAMRTAVAALTPQPSVLVIDAVHIPGVDIPQVSVIKGDAKCYSVAAASILAKVTRDHLMEEYDQQFPEYGFASHKGYGTAAHIAALQKYGPCPIHRRSFITHFVT